MNKPAPSNIVTHDLRALVVDDNPIDRRIIVAVLQKLGFTFITEAENGAVADFKIKNSIVVGKTFDAVIVDWEMPQLNGLGLLKRIRENGKTKSIPVLMLTASPTPERVESALQNGITGFLVKPIRANEFSSKIKTMLAL